jgi:hypothetical protein
MALQSASASRKSQARRRGGAAHGARVLGSRQFPVPGGYLHDLGVGGRPKKIDAPPREFAISATAACRYLTTTHLFCSAFLGVSRYLEGGFKSTTKAHADNLENHFCFMFCRVFFGVFLSEGSSEALYFLGGKNCIEKFLQKNHQKIHHRFSRFPPRVFGHFSARARAVGNHHKKYKNIWACHFSGP